MHSTDPLVPLAALLPLCDSRSGGQFPLEAQAGRVRPYVATLAVRPIEFGKHDTTSTRWSENKATQESRDGEVVKDTVSIQHTDT